MKQLQKILYLRQTNFFENTSPNVLIANIGSPTIAPSALPSVVPSVAPTISSKPSAAPVPTIPTLPPTTVPMSSKINNVALLSARCFDKDDEKTTNDKYMAHLSHEADLLIEFENEINMMLAFSC